MSFILKASVARRERIARHVGDIDPAEWATNEPAGLSAVVYRGFSSKAADNGDRGTGSFPSKTGGSEGWDGIEYSQPNFTIETDATAPESASSVGRITYPVGLPAADGPAVVQTQPFGSAVHGSLELTELYVRAYLRLSSNYYVGSITNKLWFHRTADDADRGEPYIRLANNGSGGYVMQVNMQGTPDDDRSDGAWWQGTFAATTSPGNAIARDEWFQVETYVQLNTGVAVRDGVIRVWVNGVLAIDIDDALIINVEGDVWGTVHISPTYGGGSPDPNDTEFYFDIDHMYVKGA